METKLIVCINSRPSGQVSCADQGSVAMADQLEAMLKERALPITLKRILCFGTCDKGPNMRIAPGGAFFRHVTPDDLPGIIDAVEKVHNASND